MQGTGSLGFSWKLLFYFIAINLVMHQATNKSVTPN